jgi:hypothetical protein
MQFQLLPFLLFHLRRYVARQTAQFALLALSALAMLTALVVSMGLSQAQADALARNAYLKSQQGADQQAVAVAPNAAVSLRAFDSAQAVKDFDDIADRSGISVTELTFTLDEGKTQPFLRYRASMTVAANYLAIRRFVDQVGTDVPDVSLDTISCSRKALDDPILNCDLVFTEFFKKDDRG